MRAAKTEWRSVLAMFSTNDPELTARDRRDIWNARARDRRAQHPDVKAKSDACARRWYHERGGAKVLADTQRLRLYGLTPERHAQMLLEQGGRCAMPGCDAAPKHVDHDHATGKVRALLCHGCNIGLGHFERHGTQFARYLARFDKETTHGR